MKKLTIAAILVGLGASAAIAQVAIDAPHSRAPETRADVTRMVADHFAKLDTDRDGAVTSAEADAGRTAMHKEMRDRHFQQLDADGNGSISRAEFDAGHDARAEGRKDHGMKGRHGKHGHHDRMAMLGGKRMFERADVNSDGKVTLNEATTSALARFDAVDTDRNGTISSDERKAHHAKIRAEWKAKATARAAT